ncbi:hypothetical protein M427DRAFT_60283 [Gonapodya prolifera JEL478]|uniref:Uncharacterized protein n=1 Tax=Gonapodya prolifera (strain JEL478) TaxID=1344416 RepID=A0A139A646_GONPJ|nr:hypothetical protein M427DRAFT_60283 [Gonapodya prolifera JEL478]|eukprot:KXS11853.1 hypothetical protein M427DRAFT_60283 [Gonapodya prolifera JEL478]
MPRLLSLSLVQGCAGGVSGDRWVAPIDFCVRSIPGPTLSESKSSPSRSGFLPKPVFCRLVESRQRDEWRAWV